MEKLKRAFNASKAYRNDSWEDIEEELDSSKGMVSKVLSGKATSAPLVERIKEYVNDTGIIKSIDDAGLDPDARKDKLATKQ
jgi:hypothetical protein